MEENKKKAGRPAWFKIIIILFVCYTVCVFLWLGWMVMTGEKDDAIPEKFGTPAIICITIVFFGPFLIVGLDLSIKIIRRMKKWANE
jgi:hypothetical protein